MSDRKPKIGDEVCWWDNKSVLAGNVTKLSDTHATVRCGKISFDVAFSKIDWEFSKIKSRATVPCEKEEES